MAMVVENQSYLEWQWKEDVMLLHRGLWLKWTENSWRARGPFYIWKPSKQWWQRHSRWLFSHLPVLHNPSSNIKWKWAGLGQRWAWQVLTICFAIHSLGTEASQPRVSLGHRELGTRFGENINCLIFLKDRSNDIYKWFPNIYIFPSLNWISVHCSYLIGILIHWSIMRKSANMHCCRG